MEVRVMEDDGGTEIEKEGWLVGKLPLQSVYESISRQVKMAIEAKSRVTKY